jgi:hypothetical protein
MCRILAEFIRTVNARRISAENSFPMPALLAGIRMFNLR